MTIDIESPEVRDFRDYSVKIRYLNHKREYKAEVFYGESLAFKFYSETHKELDECIRDLMDALVETTPGSFSLEEFMNE